MKWFTTLRDRKINTATELLTTTSTQLARRRVAKTSYQILTPVGSEVRIARDFMLAGHGGVIDCLHFRGQASTIIIITHRVKVAGIVCVKNRLTCWLPVGKRQSFDAPDFVPEYFSTNPLNRTGQHILLDEVSPLTDVDESKAASGVGADMDFRARWEGFVGFGRLQCVPKSYRIVPNLAGGVLLFGTPLDQLLAAPAIQAGNFGTGRDVRFNQPLPAALAGVFSHRHSLLHCFGGAILSDYSPQSLARYLSLE